MSLTYNVCEETVSDLLRSLAFILNENADLKRQVRDFQEILSFHRERCKQRRLNKKQRRKDRCLVPSTSSEVATLVQCEQSDITTFDRDGLERVIVETDGQYGVGSNSE